MYFVICSEVVVYVLVVHPCSAQEVVVSVIVVSVVRVPVLTV